jgi:hypothetical protein
MPVDLETQILKVIRARTPQDRPMTIGDLARHFGANPAVVTGCARRIVDNGNAVASMVLVHGVPTLHGLSPQPVATPE